MRLHRLEIEGFGPFRDRQMVDFDRFADDGIFLIAGRTGAGKSSILDAVCFGLYGGVPRYDGGEKRLRSDHSEPDDASRVVVEFSTVAGRFRVTRSPEYLRPAKRGGGMTKQAAGVSLDEWSGEMWIGRAARAVDVAGELDEILQLSREQFLQVILLAQNRFSEFLLAGSKERQALLRRLFGTERFDDVQARFDERRRSAENALGARLATVAARVGEAERLATAAELWGGPADASGEDGVSEVSGVSEVLDAVDPVSPTDEAPSDEAQLVQRSGTTDDRLGGLRRAQARAEYRAERRIADRDDAEARLTTADAALAALREDRRAQTERDRARAAVEEIERREPIIAAARTELAEARAAEVLRAPIEAAARASRALQAARLREDEHRARWDEADAPHRLVLAGEDAAAEIAALDSWAADRTKEVGAWARAQHLEAGLDALLAEQRAAEDAVAAARTGLETRDAERAALPQQLAEATVARDDARRIADRQGDLLRAKESADARIVAVRESTRLLARELEDDAAVVGAAERFAVAQTVFAQLRRRRSEGMAGELATALVDGEPCPVCGSHEHPAPAVHADPVSADDVAAAEAARDSAAEVERAAAAALAATRAALAAAAALGEGRTLVQAEEEQAAAASALAQSIAAAREADALAAEVEALASRSALGDEQRMLDAAVLATAHETRSLVEQRLTDARAQIAEAKGDSESVALRVALMESAITEARTLSSAIADRVRRAEEATSAEEDRDSALATSDFDGVPAVELAFRTAAEQEALAARIDEHAAQRGKERAILLDLELLTLPEEPIDLSAVERTAVDARAAWTTSVDVASRAVSTADQLVALIADAASEHAAMAEDATEFEVLRGLADAIAGRGENTRKMTLETFVLAAELEEIVDAANRRLDDMSSGRYQLRHSDALAARGAASGLGIDVFDAFTGQTRPARSLSGGETFLSSLALALGLAEVVTARAGGIRLDTLFIDEGFGSLDGDTLDVAMRTLDELRQGGRTVGVISHVEAMQEQIPAQLRVRATAEGPSVIEMR